MTHNIPFETPRIEVYRDLETRVAQDPQTVVRILEDHIAEVDTGAGFVDPKFEDNHVDSIMYVQAVVDVLRADSPPDSAWAAGYQGFHFAHILGSLVLPAGTGIAKEGIFDDVETPEELRDTLEITSVIYLGERQTLAEVTRHFLPEIDVSGQCRHVAEVVAATTMLFIDQAESARVEAENKQAWLLQFGEDSGLQQD